MLIRDRILECLRDSPKSNRQLHEMIPDKSTRLISATISNNPEIFLRLEKALVGLRNRDEDKVTGRPIKHGTFCLYMKMVNLLANGEKRMTDMIAALPDEKPVSIRATVNMRPDLFIRVARGVIGRAGRDEYLIQRYYDAKISTQAPRSETINEKAERILQSGPKTFIELVKLMPDYPKNSISAKLSLNPRIVNFEKRWYLIKNYCETSKRISVNSFENLE